MYTGQNLSYTGPEAILFVLISVYNFMELLVFPVWVFLATYSFCFPCCCLASFFFHTDKWCISPLMLSDSRTAHVQSLSGRSSVEYRKTARPSYNRSLATDGKEWTFCVLFLCQNLWCRQNCHHRLICGVNRPTKLCHRGKTVEEINTSEHILYRM